MSILIHLASATPYLYTSIFVRANLGGHLVTNDAYNQANLQAG